MKHTTRTFSFIALSLAIVMVVSGTLQAQRGVIKIDTKMLYHDGPVMQGAGSPRVYIIWYGDWRFNPAAVEIIEHFTSSIGSSPYFLINTTYPDSTGNAPTGGLVHAGSVYDSYSQGPTLTHDSIQQIITRQIDSVNLPLDTTGIYLIIGSSDVTDIRPDGSTFCTPGTTPYHGVVTYEGAFAKFGYLGAADRCPTSAGPQFIAADGSFLPSPNLNFAADAMASSLANLFDVILTNPIGTGWFDRYGLENADKCMGKFGTTYTAALGARANMRLAGREFLIQQNWINDRRGRCALSILD